MARQATWNSSQKADYDDIAAQVSEGFAKIGRLNDERGGTGLPTNSTKPRQGTGDVETEADVQDMPQKSCRLSSPLRAHLL